MYGCGCDNGDAGGEGTGSVLFRAVSRVLVGRTGGISCDDGGAGGANGASGSVRGRVSSESESDRMVIRGSEKDIAL